jgi:peptidyl-prolyl cis-trans isomerase D
MFDLFRSRDKAVRILLGGLLLMVAFSMLIYLIPGANMPSAGNRAEVVAEIGPEKVTTNDIQEIIQDKVRGRQVPAEMMQFLVPQIVDQAISDRAIEYEAKRLGYEVTDADLAYAIRSIPNLANLPPDQYRNAVESMGQTVPQFEANMRSNIYALRMQDLALSGVVVTPQEVQTEFNRLNEKIKIEYVSFDPAKLKAEVKPTPEALQTYFSHMKATYNIPETRSFGMAVVDPDRVAATMDVSDAALHQYYDSHRDQFRTPERVKVRHILLMTQGKPKGDIDKIKAKADDLLKQIKAGADFGELAKKNSEDPGSKAAGGDMDWIVRGQTVKNFENTAFALKKDEISPVISTEYGFHIVQLRDKQDARLQSFDEVKTQIGNDMKKGGLNDRVQTLADQARAEIAKAPQNAEQIANKLGLIYTKVDRARSGAPLPIVGTEKTVSDTIFGTKKGDVTPVMQAGNRLLVAVVDAVNPPRPADYSEVESQVRDAYLNVEATKLVAERSKEAADLLKSNGGDLKAVAKKFGLEVKTSDLFSRQGAVEGVGSASYFSDAFTKLPGTILGAINVGTQTVVAKLDEKQSPDPAKLAQDRQSIVMQIKNKKTEERDKLFQDSIMNKLTEEHKIKIHKDVINRIEQGYRS